MPRRSSIPEHLLREVWKDHSAFLVDEPRLADGTPLRVLDAGAENLHRGGPDFLGARVAMEDVAVSGDVELHISLGDWDAHDHSSDARYSNVVLHVVLEEEDEESDAHAQAHVVGHGGRSDVPHLPTLVLRDNLRFDRQDLWEQLFQRVYDRSPELPCFPHNLAVPISFKRRVLEKFGEARLDELVDRVSTSVAESEVSSESALLERVYQLTMDALGYSENRTPFRELSSILPRERLQWVAQHYGAKLLTTFEALFFGVAGLLPKVSREFDVETNEYLLELNMVWNELRTTMSLPETLVESDWAFFRIRPLNSPYRRLALAAYLAATYFSDPDFSFDSSFFHAAPKAPLGTSIYWESRTSFHSPATAASTTSPTAQMLLGTERSSALWLNVILPARIARVRQTTGAGGAAQRERERELRKAWGDTRTKASAKYLNVLSQELLESENVICVRSEQGGLTLVRHFCERARCAECPIGDRLIQNGWQPKKSKSP